MNKIDTLLESLPKIKDIAGRSVVIKYGGHAMIDEDLKKSLAEDINFIKLLGGKPIIVHGGGPQINALLNKLSIESKFIQGMRVTDESVMNVVEMVLCGKVNKDIVSRINGHSKFAVGISGKDADLIEAEKLIIKDKNNMPLDIGFVGKVKNINTDILNTFLDNGFIPIIAPVGIGKDRKTYNINADVAAASIAAALSASYLIFITDVEGVMDASGNIISSINVSEIEKMIRDNVITGGMIPKINHAMEAISKGVENVRIINGKRKHSLLYALFTDEKIGTSFYRS